MSRSNIDKIHQLNEEYKKVFGEYYPLMLARNFTDKEIIKSMEQCIKTKKPYDIELKEHCLY